ncbi:hypothetical protein FRB96_004924 [Tulasnella sp. 330]|nr:hypothetical protein FRB96_004924 [Tulasnella sp. 330]KAG8873403.1 hypothetical protein FRB97_006743 [Tulasnella sp. 331]KAG8877967.1 hypothetical protein FRB98_006423 [Tulasnella sp. 332]
MKTHAAPDMVVRVPRHGTIPPPPAVVEAAKKLVESEGGILKAEETVDPHSPEGEGMANASEWNSMLLTARAARGPQWDVSSQLFQVDKDSHLYYDFAPLMAGDEPEYSAEQQQQHNQPQSQTQSQVQTPSRYSYASPSPSVRRAESVYNPSTPNYAGTATPPALRFEMPPPPSDSGRRRITRNSAGRDN